MNVFINIFMEIFGNFKLRVVGRGGEGKGEGEVNFYLKKIGLVRVL